jgi:transcriptional regulator with XRE-family HTH domain
MITAPQLRAARALLGWSQDDLARRSKVSKPTIVRLEHGEGEIGGYPSTRGKLQRALEAAGIEFTNRGEPGVRLRKGDVILKKIRLLRDAIGEAYEQATEKARAKVDEIADLTNDQMAGGEEHDMDTFESLRARALALIAEGAKRADFPGIE